MSASPAICIPKPASSMPAPCARSSARPPRRCFSPRASSTTAPSSARRASSAPSRAISTRASPIRPSRCSRTGWRPSRARRPRAPPRPAWRRCTTPSSARCAPAITWSPPRRCSAPAAGSSRNSCRASASPRRSSTASTSTNGAARCGRTPRCSSSKARPIRRSRCSTSRRSRRSPTRPARRLVVDNVFATPIFQSPLALGADCVVYSATKHIDGQGRCLGGIILGVGEVHPGPHPQPAAPDRPGDVAVQRLGAAQGAGDAAAARRAADRRTPAAIADLLAGHPKVTRLIYPGRADHPQAATVKKQMRGGSNLVAFEVGGRQAGGVPLPQRAQARAHHQQSRRRQEPGHPSGDDDPPAPDAGGARRARHHRRAGALLGRARARRRHRGGPDGGAGEGVIGPTSCPRRPAPTQSGDGGTSREGTLLRRLTRP